jgi:predicted PurR-regulated permease PerM
MGDAPELTPWEKECKAKRMANPQIYGNPVFDPAKDWRDSINEKTKSELGDEDEAQRIKLWKFQEIYAMADIEHIGYLGRKNFRDLLKILDIEVEGDKLDEMFAMMDENNDNQIDFGEFLTAMVSSLTDQQLEAVDDLELGACGTSKWARGEIAWAANCGLLVICIGIFTNVLLFFEFVLVPLTLAYFLTFLYAPVMDLFEHRPVECGPASCCEMREVDPEGKEDPLDGMEDAARPSRDAKKPTLYETRYKSEFRRSIMGTWKGGCFDFFTTVKINHGMCVLLMLFGTFAGLGVLVSVIVNEVQGVLGDPKFMNDLNSFVEDTYANLNSSGIKILRYDGPEGYTSEDISNHLSTISAAFNWAALLLLLTVYIMSEKTDRTLFNKNNVILMEIETQVKYYIALKFALSFLTGLVVAIILLGLQVKLAVMFGLLSFLLNFIPNVGSMIAMVLPLPIVIVDPNLATWQKIGSFVGPGAVQGYVGNALEPMVFGKSLNMTPMSILMALVIWSSIWGIIGAILSVPLLGIQKILLSHANHPMAKYFMTLIREDPTIDETAEAS